MNRKIDCTGGGGKGSSDVNRGRGAMNSMLLVLWLDVHPMNMWLGRLEGIHCHDSVHIDLQDHDVVHLHIVQGSHGRIS